MRDHIERNIKEYSFRNDRNDVCPTASSLYIYTEYECEWNLVGTPPVYI